MNKRKKKKWTTKNTHILSDFREALLTAVGANEFIWDNQLRAKLPSAHITTYQYKPGVGVVNTIREGI